MKIESKIIKIFVVFMSAAAIILIFVAGFLVWQQRHSVNYKADIALIGNQPQSIFQKLPQAQEATEPIKMLFFGDMMLDRNVGLVIKQKGLDYLFEKLAAGDFFQDKDIIVCNLEGAVVNEGAHYLPNNAYDFAFSPEFVGRLKSYGFNFFNLANNHLIDQGERGISETRQNLDKLGFNYSGCPDGQIAECSGRVIEVKNRKIGLAGFSAVYSKLDQEKLATFVGDLASSTDLLIVNMHWGNEYQHQFSQYQQELAWALIDSGADIIVGHHPHVVEGMEIYRGKPIFYSLGNFIFDQYFSADTQENLALDLIWEDKNLEIFLIPLKSKQSQSDLMTEAEKNNFLQKFIIWSQIGPEYIEQVKAGKIDLKNSYSF